MHRFYKSVDVAGEGDGFTVRLDGKPVRTPCKAPLKVPARALAGAIAREWEDQTDAVRPAAMPLTQLATTAIDRVSVVRDSVIDTIAAYAQTDLLCYRADYPADLVRRQTDLWQPLLDWTAITYDASLVVTTGIVPVAQPPAALAALRRVIAAQDDLRLMALHNATALCGSVIVGLALLAGRIGPDEAFEISQLDETFQIERWGEDVELAARRAAVRKEIEATAEFTRLLDAA